MIGELIRTFFVVVLEVAHASRDEQARIDALMRAEERLARQRMFLKLHGPKQ